MKLFETHLVLLCNIGIRGRNDLDPNETSAWFHVIARYAGESLTALDSNWFGFRMELDSISIKQNPTDSDSEWNWIQLALNRKFKSSFAILNEII